MENKLIFIGFNISATKIVTEMSYIPIEKFNKLMANGIVRYDGLWIQQAGLWPVFFEALAIERNQN